MAKRKKGSPRFIGVERCRKFTPQTKICVYGARYGFSAWLTDRSGRKLAPISINARTAKAALRQAYKRASAIRRRGQ